MFLLPLLVRCLCGAACAALLLVLAAPAYAVGIQLPPEPAVTDDDQVEPGPPAVQAIRRTQSVAIDGVLDESAWSTAPVIDTFTQREPDEGRPATERTVVRVLYDDEAIYLGVRLYDSAPDSIVARLGRRDASLEADRFTFSVDPYHDRRTGFFFTVNAAGTLSDGVLYNDDWDDDTWDGVWQGKARIDGEGWTVEMRIPYSQLRFQERDRYVWGVNFHRYLARHNEHDYFVMTPSDESGFVSRFADMVGIEQITPPRQIEVTPYVTAKAAYTDVESGNPFRDGSDYTPDLGADFKIGLTPNLTLNGTVNPDFGQVEVDPAVVNLSDVEVFFPERRPFFIEGSTIFNFGYGGSNSNWGFNFGNPDFFYSRRIGRAPQGSLPDHDYADVPDGTRIMGAAKLTGKVGKGWNVGTVQAVTAQEAADLFGDGDTWTAEVEPRTYYGIARAQREFEEGRRALGVIGTSTIRQLDGSRLEDELNGAAYVGGLDGWTFLDQDRMWVVTGWAGLSHVRGTEGRLTDLQQSSLHYFQRPDADHVSVDTNATALTGLAGRVMLNKQKGNVYTNAAVGFISPAFDVNDAGFLWRTDIINAHAVVGYRWYEPRGIYRRVNSFVSHFQSYDFGGNRTALGFWTNHWVQFKNYVSANLGGDVSATVMDNRATRGGPLMKRPGSYVVFGGVESDNRKPVVLGADFFRWHSERGSEWNVELEAEWRPAANVAVSAGPELELGRTAAQYVTAVDDPTATATFGRRYVFGELDRTTLSANVRLNWTFTPGLSLQLFAQPLIAAGDYTAFKELAAPETFDFTVYGQDAGSIVFDADEEEYVIDPDGVGAAEPFTFGEQDFNFKSLRGTAVLRWEFRPGSTLFFVWTQTRDTSVNDGSFRFGRDTEALLGATPDNIFVVKLTYWLSR